MLFSIFHIYYSVCLFFFFKQKTAYEMRISDWSSDVCSSDLVTRLETVKGNQANTVATINGIAATPRFSPDGKRIALLVTIGAKKEAGATQAGVRQIGEIGEHYEIGRATSELQSLMRISYAVFCLKKKQINTKHQTNNT